jgi:hypothetical protein
VTASEATELIDSIIAYHKNGIQKWVLDFGSVLARAKRNAGTLPDGWVYQRDLKEHFLVFDKALRPKAEVIDDKVTKFWLAQKYSPKNVYISWMQAALKEPTGKANIAHAIKVFDFFGDEIGYQIDQLVEWDRALMKWSEEMVAMLVKFRKTLRG